MPESNISTARQSLGSVGAIHANCASPNVFGEKGESPPTEKRKRGGQPGNQNARIRQDQMPKKQRGAPLGNQNARTFGFYSRKLPAVQLMGLEDTTVRSVEDEIELMRVFARKVAELGAEVDNLDEAKSLLNTLSNATGSINRLVRTHAFIPDPTLDPNLMLRQALLALEEEWPELKRFANDSLTPEEIAELDAKIAVNAAREAERLKREYGNPDLPAPELQKTCHCEGAFPEAIPNKTI